MLFRQWVAPGEGRCSYALVDDGTGVGALVDPVPELESAYRAYARERSFRFAFVLETRLPPEEGHEIDGRYTEMVAALGLESHIEEVGPPVGEGKGLAARLGALRVGPLRSWIGEGEDGAEVPTVLQVGGTIVELRGTCRSDRPREWLVADPTGPIDPPVRLAYDGARLLLGREIVDVRPCGAQAGALAYLWRDRLFTGRPVRSPVREAEGRPPRWCRSLAQETLVFPGQVRDGLRVSTLGQELEDRPRESRAEPELPAGTWNSRGFCDLDPEEARPVLHRFQVLSIGDATRSPYRMPGARPVDLRTLAGVVEGWSRAEPILVVSETGVRCGSAVLMLQRMGFERVYRLLGGLELWSDHGFPVHPVLETRHTA